MVIILIPIIYKKKEMSRGFFVVLLRWWKLYLGKLQHKITDKLEKTHPELMTYIELNMVDTLEKGI
jgi:hypothetical protein